MMNIKAFHPGIYIKDSLDVMEMTSKEFSARTGISERTLSSIITGKGDITFEVAYKLAEFFDNSVNFWTNLQNQYDIYLKESEKETELKNDGELFKKIEKYLFENKFISDEQDKISNIYNARKIAGVNSLSLLNTKDSLICFKEVNTQKTTDFFAQNFWIALALNEARKKISGKYDKEKLINYIPEIRSLTIKEPNFFYPRLQEIFNECGISFVLLPYLTKSNIYGATKWFSKNNVMLAISNRNEKADLFWFTLFHEISHVLMEHRREALVNIDGSDDEVANKMAENMLISELEWNEFIKKESFTIDSIENFALKVNILPCIVLGRLHKERPNLVPYGKFDKFFNISYTLKN